VTSSRRIGALCRTDVAFRVICAGDVPDHVTIARFRAAFPGVAQELFTRVLMLCARLGMGKTGTVALDGTKVAANAAEAANRTEEALRKLAAEHAAADADEDERFGEGGPGTGCRRTRPGRAAGMSGSGRPWLTWKPSARPRRRSGTPRPRPAWRRWRPGRRRRGTCPAAPW
jgi:hypothetical protein